jgi:hypothetical protein
MRVRARARILFIIYMGLRGSLLSIEHLIKLDLHSRTGFGAWR